ncbi:hypothetical protein PHYBOEH_005665 [Phytophthora boehmeriae]|uniref:Uncharacterized protein n=1 Tax=Phytophthora boehmeriae TaxID=109152 RepID=A0A8T1WQL5_9STRA|nr:hypothetical protein PHYBOEH_005665 [Phytophthora boehmeriae]
MRSVEAVSTDDLVNSLLNSVKSKSSSNSAGSASSSPASDSGSSASASSGSDSTADSPSTPSTVSKVSTPSTTPSPATPSPATPSPATSQSSGSKETVTGQQADSGDGGGGGAGLSIGIAIGVLALVVATLLFLRSRRRRRTQKETEPTPSPPAGATCLTVPAGRGFAPDQRELGMPEMSIELPPGEHLGFSKGFDVSYASSARSSASSNPYNPSLASSDGSVFNTVGGVSPTFSSRKMASYSYQYRSSSDGENGNANANGRSAGSTAFRLTQLAGSAASGRGGNTKLSRVPSGRTLSAADEYTELVTATNAKGHVDMETHSADFTQTGGPQNEMDISMGPDSERHMAGVPIRNSAVPIRNSAVPIRASAASAASDMSMGPDSPSEGRPKRSGSVYDTIPKLSGENMSSSIASSDATASQRSAAPSLGVMPLLQSMSSAESSDYGEDMTSERASSESTDSGNTQRSGSLIALNLETTDGTSEIAI